MLVNNACIRIVSDYSLTALTTEDVWAENKEVHYVVIPQVLSLSEVGIQGRATPYPSDYTVHGFRVFVGNEFRRDKIIFAFTSKVRAEVCRDDILEAIGKFYGDNKPRGAWYDV